MKKLVLLLLLALNVTISKASDKEIIATVVFENTTGKTFSTGEFYITETNKRIEISTLDSFKITLPEKGKYIFSFSTPDFETYTVYPVVISERKNIITIKLIDKKETVRGTIGFSKPLILDSQATQEQIEQLVLAGQVYFITHGLDNSIPQEYMAFQQKYGISLKKENCAIDPLSFKIARENNQIIANYLDSKYGKDWFLELDIKPFGVK